MSSPTLVNGSNPPPQSSQSPSTSAAAVALTNSSHTDPNDPNSVGSDGLTSKEREQLNLQSSAFDALERDFREVLNELVGDKSLERFRLEYEKLHHTLKKSHENEKRLIKKCRELNGEIVANAAKIQTALRLSLQDQNSITLLKKEIDKAWKMVDGAQEKEKRARETIQRLKSEIQNLSRLVDQGAGLSIGQENAVNDLLKIKEDLTAEVEAQQNAIEVNNKKITELEKKVQELEERKLASDKEILQLKDKNAKVKAEAQREVRRADRLQQEMLTIKEVNDKRKADLSEKQQKLDEMSDKCMQMDTNMRALTAHLDKQQNLADELSNKNMELTKSIEFHIHRQGELIADKEAAENEVSQLKKELKKRIGEVGSILKKKEKIEKEKEQILSLKIEAEKYRNWLKDEMKNILKSVENQKKDSELDEKLIKELQQQVKRLTATLHISQEKNAMQFKLVEDHEQVKNNLEEDILNHKLSEQDLRKKNYKLEKEKEKESMKSNTWFLKYQELQESLKLKEMENAELTKNIIDEKNKLKMQQTLYEQVRSDRNLFSKQQVQSEDEIAEMKRKFKIMTHQIDQLKEEIQAKDAALINEHFAYKRLQDEMKVSKRKLSKRKEVLTKADQVLASQDSEIKNLRRTLMEAEAAQHQQKRIYDDVVQERDILGTQLIRRNDELALLYEKIRIQQSTLNKGEEQYRNRLMDVRRLKLEMNNCFPADDHELFTLSGFMSLERVQEWFASGAKQLTIGCYVEGKLEWHDIKEEDVTIAEGEFDMVEFASTDIKPSPHLLDASQCDDANISLVATANHRMYGRIGRGEHFDDYKIHQAGVLVEVGASHPTAMFQMLTHFAGEKKRAMTTDIISGTQQASSMDEKNQLEMHYLRSGYSVSSTPLSDDMWTIHYSMSDAHTCPLLNLSSHTSVTTRSLKVWCVTVPTVDQLIMFRRVLTRTPTGEPLHTSRPVIVGNTRRQLQIRSHEVTNIEALKNEVYHVQRELLQERTKVKALSEELENPMNVHRWRKLEGADPKRYELIQKIQTLQKRLIQKTESVVEKDLLLQEKEKLYVELKNLLARQPGPEVAEQLSKYQHTLKEKTRQMKAMAAELNMLQAQVNEYRYEIERTTRELQDTKRKFFESRRKEQQQERKESAMTIIDPMTEQQRIFLATQPRITGGGFNLQAMNMNATQ